MDTLFDTTIASVFKSSKATGKFLENVRTGKLPLALAGVHGSLPALLARTMQHKFKIPLVCVFPTEKEAELFCADCAVLGVSAQLFPAWGVLPYHTIAPNSPVFGQRVQIMTDLLMGKTTIVACGIRAFCSILPAPEHFKTRLFTIREGMQLDPQKLATILSENGYMRVNRVSVPGEFAGRGEVSDLFLPGSREAARIVFDFEEIKEIRGFDPITQASSGRIRELTVHPFRECVWSEAEKQCFVDNLESLPEFRLKDLSAVHTVKQAVLAGNLVGEETWYPLAWPEKSSLLSYVPSDGLVMFHEYERLYSAAEGMGREFFASYRKARVDQGCVPRPERLIHNLTALQSIMKRAVFFPLLHQTSAQTVLPVSEFDDESLLGSANAVLSRQPEEQNDRLHDLETIKAPTITNLETIAFGSEAPRSFFGNLQFFKEELLQLTALQWQIVVCSENETQVTRLKHMLSEMPVTVLESNISAGFSLPLQKFMVVHEHEIFGRKRRLPQSLRKVQSKALDTFVELEPGDYVVHVHHGIGRFCSIKRIKAGGTERDYIELEYAGDEFVFVPIEQVNLVQRYIGSQGDAPRLDTIGGKSWDSRKARVRKSVEELAGHLIGIYSKRKAARGFAFSRDSEWQIQFETAFPFEETEDQVRCIEEVKADMEKPVPMDRLVCGDVGYGKTEIALRAAFKAISSGKQVAILSPTTILAEQHMETLEDRLKGFPVKVGMLSRFVQPRDQKKVLAGLESGEIDLVVGTHRVIQKDVRFKDLGLMIVDEEQRFGVKDKERLKEWKANIDCLTLTATPIPRTLHMSLLKIRDMSVLQTPPYNRKPIETFVHAFDEQIVAQAIRKEIERGGQIFYLHNRVETLEQVRMFIEKLVPEVLVDIAHGQMGPQDLEDIMHRFIHGAFHVLVATTIIENGINIPNVNTIIIERADMYGISQLYQLRGRVGRSGRLAYAYLLYPGERALSELAMKRLQIISDHTELGSGFKIALKDLEVRGAGNLLGAEQSGDILSVGFEMYLRLLDEAVRRLSHEEQDSGDEVHLDLEYTGFIPDSYVREAVEKMELYKKIASISRETELESVYAEIVDRFGPLPEEVQSLMSLAELRILCRKLKIASLKERKGMLQLEFSRISHLNLDKVMRMIQQSGGKIKPDPSQPNILHMKTEQIGLKEKSEFLRDQLYRLL